MALAIVSGVTIFAGLAYQLTEHGHKLAKRGSVANSLDIPLSYVTYLAVICCALGIVAVVLTVLRKD